jgi:hypothetical protein
MLFRQEGPQVAVVGNDGKVQLRPISIGRDYGTTLEIVGGSVDVNDRIIVNPSDSIENGQQVRVAEAQEPQQPRSPEQLQAPQEQQPKPAPASGGKS